MSMSPQKTRRVIRQEIDRAGLDLDRVEIGRHVKFYIRTPAGPAILVTASTIGDHRALLNCRAQIARLARGRA